MLTVLSIFAVLFLTTYKGGGRRSRATSGRGRKDGARSANCAMRRTVNAAGLSGAPRGMMVLAGRNARTLLSVNIAPINTIRS